jgi:cytochrome P450
MLRYESPAQRTTFRTVAAPVVIGGHALEPGDQVGAIIGSANRDEEVFADGERFDSARDPNPHLAFGSGGYACLGKTLARTEARIALSKLLAAFPRMEPAGKPRWRRNSFFRALQTLPVRLGPRA